MSSALDARPRLRADLRIVRRQTRDKVYYVVKLPAEGKYFQFGETEIRLMELMDGARTPAEIAAAAEETLGVRPHAGQVADFAQRLKRLGVVERTAAEKHLMLMEHVRAQRKVRARGRAKGSILRMTYSIGDPDRLFERWVKPLAWMWTGGFVAVSLFLFGLYGVVIAGRWGEFVAGAAGLYSVSGFSPLDYVLLYVLALSVVAVHELGHGLTTKHFGGEVHEIGAMLMYFSPALFCNTNDAWTFEKRSHRLWVTFAGPWIQLLIASLAAIAWAITESGTLVNRLAFLTVLGGGILSILMNFNPLIPLDGYYALSDWLEIPNLRRRAFAYYGWLGKRWLLGMDVAEPPATPRERRVFLIYGGLALVYSVFFAIVSLFWLVLVVGRFIGPWVWVLVLWLVGRGVARLSGRSRTVALAATTAWQAGFLRGRRTALLAAALAVVVSLPFLLPWTLRAKGEFRIEAAPRVQVRAQVGGIVDRVLVREGDTVGAEEPLVELWSPQLQAEVLRLEARVERLRILAADGLTTGDLAGGATSQHSLASAARELELLRSRRARLVVRTPVAGVVVGHRLHERLGAHVSEGAGLMEIAPPGRLARVRVPQKWAGELAAGQRAHLKLPVVAHRKFKGTVARVAPAMEEGWLEAEVSFPASTWTPAPGMSGIAKIATRRTSVAGALLRAFRQTVRTDLWL